jgi:hypothetical protein
MLYNRKTEAAKINVFEISRGLYMSSQTEIKVLEMYYSSMMLQLKCQSIEINCGNLLKDSRK